MLCACLERTIEQKLLSLFKYLFTYLKVRFKIRDLLSADSLLNGYNGLGQGHPESRSQGPFYLSISPVGVRSPNT